MFIFNYKNYKYRSKLTHILVNIPSNVFRSEPSSPTTIPKIPKQVQQSTQQDIPSGEVEEEEPYDNDDMETIDFESPAAFKILEHRDMVPKKRKNDLPKFLQYRKDRMLSDAI